MQICRFKIGLPGVLALCALCALLVVLALSPVLAQTYPIIRTTSATATLTAGTNTTSTTPESLASSASAWECLVQNDPDNAVNVLVGSASAQTIELSPGQTITFPVQNVSTIWIVAESGTPVVNYVCR